MQKFRIWISLSKAGGFSWSLDVLLGVKDNVYEGFVMKKIILTFFMKTGLGPNLATAWFRNTDLKMELLHLSPLSEILQRRQLLRPLRIRLVRRSG